MTRMYIKESTYQLKYTVSMPEKNLDLLEEAVGNDDVSIVCAASTKWLG